MRKLLLCTISLAALYACSDNNENSTNSEVNLSMEDQATLAALAQCNQASSHPTRQDDLSSFQPIVDHISAMKMEYPDFFLPDSEQTNPHKDEIYFESDAETQLYDCIKTLNKKLDFIRAVL